MPFETQTFTATEINETDLGHEMRGMVQQGAAYFTVVPHLLGTGECTFHLVGLKAEWVEPEIEG